MGLAGIYLIVSGGSPITGVFSHEHLLGNLLLLVGYLHKYGGLIPTFFSMITGTVLLLVFVAVAPVATAVARISARDWLLLAYIGVVATAIGYLVLNTAIRHVGVVRAVGFKFLIPVFGVALSVVFLRESLSASDLVGAGLVLLALYLTRARATGPGGSRAKGARPSP